MTDEIKREQMIVAEVSVSWPREKEQYNPVVLCQRFEQVIKHNSLKGYKLHSWRFSQCSTEMGEAMVETIIAVFELQETQP